MPAAVGGGRLVGLQGGGVRTVSGYPLTRGEVLVAGCGVWQSAAGVRQGSKEHVACPDANCPRTTVAGKPPAARQKRVRTCAGAPPTPRGGSRGTRPRRSAAPPPGQGGRGRAQAGAGLSGSGAGGVSRELPSAAHRRSQQAPGPLPGCAAPAPRACGMRAAPPPPAAASPGRGGSPGPA